MCEQFVANPSGPHTQFSYVDWRPEYRHKRFRVVDCNNNNENNNNNNNKNKSFSTYAYEAVVEKPMYLCKYSFRFFELIFILIFHVIRIYSSTGLVHEYEVVFSEPLSFHVFIGGVLWRTQRTHWTLVFVAILCWSSSSNDRWFAVSIYRQLS